MHTQNIQLMNSVVKIAFILHHRTKPTGSSTGWDTLWYLGHRATFGCMEDSLCQRAFWEMSTGMWMKLEILTDQGSVTLGCKTFQCKTHAMYWFRYSVSERRWTQMLTSSVEEGSAVSPRYHHAAALLTSHESVPGHHGASHSFMLVVGGVTQNGVAMDTWSLNLSSLVWREHKVRILAVSWIYFLWIA